MTSFSWKSLICGLLAAALAVPAAADDLDDLKARLEAIEAENSKLREDLDAVKTSEDVLVGQMSELSNTVDKKEDAKDPKKEDPLSFSSKWNNGWEASTKDKQFKYHVGGRVQTQFRCHRFVKPRQVTRLNHLTRTASNQRTEHRRVVKPHHGRVELGQRARNANAMLAADDRAAMR